MILEDLCWTNLFWPRREIQMKALTAQEFKELCWLWGEYEKTICNCCPEYKLADWKQKRLWELERRYRKYGAKNSRRE